jgi:hypothetical protein
MKFTIPVGILTSALLLPKTLLAAPTVQEVQMRTIHSWSDSPEIQEREPAHRGTAGYDSRRPKEIPPRDTKPYSNAAGFDSRSPKDVDPREAEPLHRSTWG